MTLSQEGEALDAHIAAMQVAFRTLVQCLRNNGTLVDDQFSETLRVEMEASRDTLSDMTLAMLHELRLETMD